MVRIFSARLDEAVLDEMDRATRGRGITKKRFLEEAIHRHAQDLAGPVGSDVWAETLGAWKRKEEPQKTVQASRRAFRRSFQRHQR